MSDQSTHFLEKLHGGFNDLELLRTHYVETIIIIITIFILIFWNTPKPDNIRKEQHKDRTIQIITDESSCDQVINDMLNNSSNKTLILGFDCEWTPALNQFGNKHYKVGLLQLATNTEIILIRINKLNYNIPDSLKSLLINPEIIKCGVGIHQDITKIYRDFNIKTLGVIELNVMYKLSSFCSTEITESIKTRSLKHLYEICCDGKIMENKLKEVTLSHWNSFDELSIDQIKYAADDAMVAYDIFMNLIDDIYGIIDSSEYISECKQFIDITEIKEKREPSLSDIRAQKKQKIVNAQREKRKKKGKENQDSATKYVVFKPDGSVLFYSGKFRFEWFLLNKLAEKVDDTSCKIIFGQDLKSNDDEKAMDNQCFVCGINGTDDNKIGINRYDIFPEHYWKNIENEEIAQKALIGNMIPLCWQTDNDCYNKAKKMQIEYIKWFCNELYPDITRDPIIMKSNKEYAKAKSYANALNKAHETIPIKRKIELVKIVADYFGLKYNEIDIEDEGEIKECEDKHFMELLDIENNEKSSREIFEECMNDLLKDDKEERKLHSKELVNKYRNNEREFVLMWRKKFEEEMKPKFVPKYWPLTKIA